MAQSITLTASMKSLKDQIIMFCEKVADDLDLILLEDMKDEIYVEYKKSLNYTEAKKKVLERKAELEKAQQITQQIEETKEANEIIIQNVDEIKPTIVNVVEDYEIVEEENLEVTFTIVTTEEKIRKLKEFLNKENIEWR